MNDRDDQGRDQDRDHDRARAQDAARATLPGRRRLLGAAAGAALAGQAAPLFAQAAYPSRPVRLVVAFGAGGIADTIARTLSSRLSERLGQQVIVDNRPGAAGALGATIVSNEFKNVVGHFGAVALGVVAQNSQPGFEVWRLHVGNETPAETASQTVFQCRNGVGHAVGGNNNLLVRAVQRVERMEKLFLEAFFAFHELDVVNE